MAESTPIKMVYTTREMVDGTKVAGYRVESIGISHAMAKVGMMKQVASYDLVADWVIERYGETGLTLGDLWKHEDEYEAHRNLPEEIMCDCGHWEQKALVMSTSRGTSCVDCYDRMSD